MENTAVADPRKVGKRPIQVFRGWGKGKGERVGKREEDMVIGVAHPYRRISAVLFYSAWGKGERIWLLSAPVAELPASQGAARATKARMEWLGLTLGGREGGTVDFPKRKWINGNEK